MAIVQIMMETPKPTPSKSDCEGSASSFRSNSQEVQLQERNASSAPRVTYTTDMSTGFCWKWLFACDTKEEMAQELKRLEAEHCDGWAFSPKAWKLRKVSGEWVRKHCCSYTYTAKCPWQLR